jgi:hypothetical protein
VPEAPLSLVPTDSQFAELLQDLSRYAPVRPYAQAVVREAYIKTPDGLDITRVAWGSTALGAQESGWGHLLTPPGPLGRGDYTARTGKWLQNPFVQVVTELPPGWSSSRPGPWAIPSDGKGFGCDVGQCDWCDARHGGWVRANPNRTPDQVAAYLVAGYVELLVECSNVEVYAAEAWNQGMARLDADLKAGIEPDSTTTDSYGARFSKFMSIWAPGGAQ